MTGLQPCPMCAPVRVYGLGSSIGGIPPTAALNEEFAKIHRRQVPDMFSCVLCRGFTMQLVPSALVIEFALRIEYGDFGNGERRRNCDGPELLQLCFELRKSYAIERPPSFSHFVHNGRKVAAVRYRR